MRCDVCTSLIDGVADDFNITDWCSAIDARSLAVWRERRKHAVELLNLINDSINELIVKGGDADAEAEKAEVEGQADQEVI